MTLNNLYVTSINLYLQTLKACQPDIVIGADIFDYERMVGQRTCFSFYESVRSVEFCNLSFWFIPLISILRSKQLHKIQNDAQLYRLIVQINSNLAQLKDHIVSTHSKEEISLLINATIEKQRL